MVNFCKNKKKAERNNIWVAIILSCNDKKLFNKNKFLMKATPILNFMVVNTYQVWHIKNFPLFWKFITLSCCPRPSFSLNLVWSSYMHEISFVWEIQNMHWLLIKHIFQKYFVIRYHVRKVCRETERKKTHWKFLNEKFEKYECIPFRDCKFNVQEGIWCLTDLLP